MKLRTNQNNKIVNLLTMLAFFAAFGKVFAPVQAHAAPPLPVKRSEVIPPLPVRKPLIVSTQASDLRVRRQPNLAAGVACLLQPGDRIFMLSQENGWAKVQTRRGNKECRGQRGYVAIRYLHLSGHSVNVTRLPRSKKRQRHSLGVQEINRGSIPASVQQRINRLFRRYQNSRHFSASVLVSKGDTILYQKSFGYAVAGKAKAHSKTNYRLASVTKHMTAAAVLLLVQDGKLRLNTKVRSIVPGLSSYGNKMTIEHLLRHRSGLRNYKGMYCMRKSKGWQFSDADVVRALECMKRRAFVYKPGRGYKYSNPAYALLAEIIERVSGMRFAEFMQKRFFNRLGMHNSVVYDKGYNSVKYRALGNGSSRSDQNIYSQVLGDGGVYTSTSDFFRWMQSIQKHTVINRELQRKAFSRGYGWRASRFRGQSMVHHTGSSIGFRNVVMHIPGKDLTVAIFTNKRPYGSKDKRRFPHPKNAAYRILGMIK